MLYMIIQNSDPQEVVDRVNKALKEGWKPLGGIAISAVEIGAPNPFRNYLRL